MCTICYPCPVYVLYIEVRMMFLVAECLLPYFCESPFVSCICVRISLLKADIQHLMCI
jgi:hypothetical protein